jgi:hypothetical protein
MSAALVAVGGMAAWLALRGTTAESADQPVVLPEPVLVGAAG